MRFRGAIRAALAVGLVTSMGCSSRGDVLPRPGEEAHEPAAEQPRAEEARGLAVRDWSAFGMPVPAGARADELGATHAHYRIDAPIDEVVAFFERELPDFEATRYDQGVKLEATDRSDRSLYVYAEGGDVLLTYYDETPEAPADASRTAAGAEVPTAPTVAPDGTSMIISANRSGGNPRGPVRPREQRTTGTAAGPSARAQNPVEADDGGSGAAPAGEPIIRGASTRIHGRGRTSQRTRRPIDFVHGTYEAPRNPDAYY